MTKTETIDDQVRRVLQDVKVIALVGASPKPARPSFQVGTYLAARGYRVIGVNPGQAGSELFGQPVYASLSDIPAEAGVQMVDIFRESAAVPAIVNEALAALSDLQVIWMQLGVESPEAAAKARLYGVEVIENRCPKIEIPRLGLG